MPTSRAVDPERSLEAVYDQLAPAVLGYVRVRGARDPENLTGDVFVSVARRLASFHGNDAALRSWVFTIAHNRLVDEHRHRARRGEHLVAVAPEIPAQHDPEPADPALLAALLNLTEEQREVVALRFLADLSIEDVARIVGKTSGAVKMLQSRALQHLARLLTAPA